MRIFFQKAAFSALSTAAVVLAVSGGAFAQFTGFTAGNLVVSRIGTGSAALSNAATAVFLDQYTTTGTLVNSLALPTAANGMNRSLTTSGTATSEGFLSVSQNGRYLTYAGYDAAPGTAGVVSTSATTVRRVAASIDSAGNVDSSTSFGTTAYNTSNIRSATTVDGTSFFAAGGNTGITNAVDGADGSTVLSTTNSPNNRVVNIFNSTLYFSTGAGTNRGIYSLGTPSGAANQTATLIANTGTNSSSYDFVFNSAGNVLYVADDGASSAALAGIRRYDLVNGAFTFSYAVTTTAVRGLSVDFTTTNAPTFYATSATGTSVITTTDTGTAGGAAAVLFSAATNTAFRDVVFSPFIASANTPEPNTLALLGTCTVPGMGLLAARRRARKTA